MGHGLRKWWLFQWMVKTMSDKNSTGQAMSEYTLYRVCNGTISDVVTNLSALTERDAWEAVARFHKAKPTPAILRSLKNAYRLWPVADEGKIQ